MSWPGLRRTSAALTRVRRAPATLLGVALACIFIAFALSWGYTTWALDRSHEQQCPLIRAELNDPVLSHDVRVALTGLSKERGC